MSRPCKGVSKFDGVSEILKEEVFHRNEDHLDNYSFGSTSRVEKKILPVRRQSCRGTPEVTSCMLILERFRVIVSHSV